MKNCYFHCNADLKTKYLFWRKKISIRAGLKILFVLRNQTECNFLVPSAKLLIWQNPKYFYFIKKLPIYRSWTRNLTSTQVQATFSLKFWEAGGRGGGGESKKKRMPGGRGLRGSLQQIFAWGVLQCFLLKKTETRN